MSSEHTTPCAPKGQTRAHRASSPCLWKRFRTLLHLESLETRCLLSSYRSISGYGNNGAHPTWGQAGTDLARVSPVAYADGIGAPSLAYAPSARAVSNALNDQADPADPSQDIQTVDRNSLTDFGYVWGQFIDHDMDLTPSGTVSFPIPVPPGDPIGPAPLPFTRSVYDPNTGTSTRNPRQQINANTSYLDLSQVYGSSQVVADALRTFAGGRLKTSPGNMLPYDNTDYFTPDQIAALNMANDAQAVPQDALFATGDVRGNENIELTALQTLFVRNHNRIAGQLQADHPGWNDEQLYQEARALNIAEEEIITYEGWIPAVLGPGALPAYFGYRPSVNASVATEFSTVGFRFGHSLLSNTINRQTDDGLDIADPAGAPVNLAQDFFDPYLLNPTSVVDPLTGQTSTDIDPILKGDADGNSQAMDLLTINEVRNLLFGDGGQGGQDLIARDIQRARDHGIGTYNQVRVAYGLPAVTSFAQITHNASAQRALQDAYGSVANIDPFEGGLAEDHVLGADVGPLFRAIMVNQFTRLRDGDRFFYLNEIYNAEEISILQQGDTLAKVIEANTGLTNLQHDVFHFRASINGTVFLNGGPGGVSGITVQLQNDGGDVLATTRTDAYGEYRFDQLSGPAANPENSYGVSATGYYQIVLVLPSGWRQLTSDPEPVLISRGNIHVHHVDFGIGRTGALSGDLKDPTLSGAVAADPAAANLAAPVTAATLPLDSLLPPDSVASATPTQTINDDAAAQATTAVEPASADIPELVVQDDWFASL